jgi:hypothetical protein
MRENREERPTSARSLYYYITAASVAAARFCNGRGVFAAAGFIFAFVLSELPLPPRGSLCLGSLLCGPLVAALAAAPFFIDLYRAPIPYTVVLLHISSYHSHATALYCAWCGVPRGAPYLSANPKSLP